MPKPTHLTTFGFGKETTKGTGVPATLWVPWKTLQPKDDLPILEDTGQRGAPVELFGTAPGIRGSELSWGGDVFADSIGVPLCSVLPDVAVTGSSAPYSTAFSTLCSGDTQPPAFTGTLADPLGTWYYPGLQCSELGFKWNADGFLSYSAKALGWGYTTGTTPTPSFTSGIVPEPNWSILNKIAGSQVFVMDGELNIKRKVEAIKGANGSQTPYAIWSGDVSVDGKLTLVMENTSQRTAFQAATQQAFEVSYTAGSGATATGLTLHCSAVVYTEGTPTYGTDYIELPVSFKGVANTTDIGGSGGYSPIKATLSNALPSGTYK